MHHGGGSAAERNLLCQGYHRVLILHVLDGSSCISTHQHCTAIAFMRHFLVALCRLLKPIVSIPSIAKAETKAITAQ